MKRFLITDEEEVRIRDWLEQEVYPKVIAQQKEAHPNPHPFMSDIWEMGYPYEGACGGGLTYEFTPTSIGMVTVAKYGDYELNFTDYGSW